MLPPHGYRPPMDPALSHCTRCGAAAPCAACPEQLFDRDGEYIWQDGPRFCARCGERLAGERLAGEHGCRVKRTINFYSVVDEYGELSNFAEYPIRLDGRRWPTTEHDFQAMKFAGSRHAEQIRRASTPSLAARMGRERTRPLRRDWHSVRIDVMRRALRAKFTQHAGLRALLLGTGDARLVEHTTNDAFWGDGGDGRGQSHLGRLLMALRGELRAEQAP